MYVTNKHLLCLNLKIYCRKTDEQLCNNKVDINIICWGQFFKSLLFGLY